MDNPTAKQLCDATGISPSYAHMILTEERKPALPLAIKIFRTTGWKHSRIAAFSDETIAEIEGAAPKVTDTQAAAA